MLNDLIERAMISRIINMRFKCCGFRFDAAIDCDWQLHCYGKDAETRKNLTPIELYNFDMPDWDIRMIYYHEDGCRITNSQQDGVRDQRGILNTICSMEFIRKEAQKWCREMMVK